MLKYFAPASFIALATTMAFSVFSCSLLGLYMAASVGARLPFKEGIAAVCTAIILAIAAKMLPTLGNHRERLASADNWWLIALLAGLAVRVGVWRMTLPEVQVNDGWHYLELARRLYMHQPYVDSGYAFWPPGAPLIYAAFMYLIGEPAWIAVVVNCAFFVLAAIAVRVICECLHFTRPQSALTVAALAFWPELFLTASQVSKETLLVGMLPTVLALLLSPRKWAALAAGAICGVTILTQPSLMLLPLFLGVALLTIPLSRKTIVIRTALLCIGAALVIAPWSFRNYEIFGEWVPISTNAGLVLHAGNQPAMVKPLGEMGGFRTPPAPTAPFKNDLLLSRWHKDQAIRFIVDNKTDFARLVWTRMIITMGDDSDSAYRSLRMTNKVPGKGYLVAKLLSNAYWMVIAALLATAAWKMRKHTSAKELAPLSILSASVTIYLMGVHGIAEGGARHHMAWSWLYGMMLVVMVARLTQYKPAIPWPYPVRPLTQQYQ
jgi:hypothetical protein